jgi:hypothetical protein
MGGEKCYRSARGGGNTPDHATRHARPRPRRLRQQQQQQRWRRRQQQWRRAAAERQQQQQQRRSSSRQQQRSQHQPQQRTPRCRDGAPATQHTVTRRDATPTTYCRSRPCAWPPASETPRRLRSAACLSAGWVRKQQQQQQQPQQQSVAAAGDGSDGNSIHGRTSQPSP